ncbi:M56 family metallopeptidase [Enterococcus sp.]|uniref:M56 family metallopeptidase n=1 Tax=Enterococcus sp. TaxID=35783 RepID=UPI00290A3C7B|nr:M56 family metallopeptidase [Enterococcus sp.]MDU5337330.1 M56 family metallopeptidase [Enterococcus sp.]
MNVTFTSFLTTLLISSLTVLILILLINKLRLNKVISANIFMGLSIIFLLRLFVPVEFFYTHAIPSDTILPRLNEFMSRQVNVLHRNCSVWQLIALIWILGSSLFLIRWVKKLYAMHSLKVMLEKSIIGSYKNIKVVTVDAPLSPVVIGLFDPLIVMPAMNFSSNEKQFVLEHELCHVNSLDLWIKSFYEVLTLIYWWNPVIWVFRKHFNQMIELKADEFVTKKLNKKEKIEYVETLVKVGKHTKNRPMMMPVINDLPSFSSPVESLLLERVNNIFYEKKAKNEKLIFFISGILGFFLSSCIIFEPYIERKNIEHDYFVITEKNSILKKIGKNSYKIYKDGKPLFEITEEQRVKEYGNLKMEDNK